MTQERINEIIVILLGALAVLVVISLISYNPRDTGFLSSQAPIEVTNRGGIIGAYIAHTLVFLVGRWGVWLVPILIVIWTINRIWWGEQQKFWIRLLGSLIILVSVACLFSLKGEAQERIAKGGIIGFRYSQLGLEYFGLVGTYVVIITLAILSTLLTTDFLILPLLAGCGRGLRTMWSRLRISELLRPRPQAQPTFPKIKRFGPEVKEEKPREEKTFEEVGRPKAKDVQPKRPIPKPEVPPKKAPATLIEPQVVGDYRLPSLDLLESPPPIEERKIADDLTTNSRVLEETLRDFGVEAKVTEVNQGPVITTYEILPAPGVKVHRITALNDDIALAMKAYSIRIVAPIPGKAAVGIEVPNSYTTLVYLREVLECDEWQSSSSKLTLALGKDIAGFPLVSDLGKMPHLLIAGTTGSGKTVCVNSLITSLLFQLTPDEVKFLMVDPKMVELACFNGLPHLLCPVVTDPNKVAGALGWVVEEMESRYRLFAKVGVRNIDLYNEKLLSKDLRSDEELFKRLPYIIVVIDELADLMAIVRDKIENAITRLAQLSRAVGIHIVLATQRPSVDVVTGVIKANFPSRVSFKVASKVDSRTVLDANGADKLLGRGDMLFMRPGTAKLIRGQGSLVSDKEIEKVVKFVGDQRQPEYNEEVLASQEKKATFRELAKDELYDEALRMALETGQASVSMLQRRMGLGYTRAARIIDMMEQEGVVGPSKGSKPRQILISKDEVEGSTEEESNQ